MRLAAEKIAKEFRTAGHYHADVDPLKLSVGQLPRPKTLDIDAFFSDLATRGLANQSLTFSPRKPGYQLLQESWVLKDVVEFMRKVYCGKIGFQFMHIPDAEVREWIQSRVEKREMFAYSKEQKLDLLRRIEETHAFSTYCERKYSTAKRFGCEGLDSGVTGLNHLIARTKPFKVEHVTVGMAHRGRLNVLACVLRKPYEHIFSEFEEIKVETKRTNVPGFSGDVKYHMGASTEVRFADEQRLSLYLLPNPSHLETVNSLLLGYSRALQTRAEGGAGATLPVVIHGDAAVCGQGIIYELQQMELLRNYTVGGTVHVIFNNQVGFTTDPCDLRSSFYASNIASLNSNFVMHVNAREPESVDFAFELALEYRMRFGRDVFIDLIGYRKAGHNEQDQPSFTQPEYYRRVAATPSLYEEYVDRMQREGLVSAEKAQGSLQAAYARLEEAHRLAKQGRVDPPDPVFEQWDRALKGVKGETGLPEPLLREVGRALTALPPGDFHRSIRKIYEERQQSVEAGRDIDWGTAEALALGSLLAEGHSVRLSGEDVERGTFSHRHAVLTDQTSSQKFCPLREYARRFPGVNLSIFNSLLSEYATMGYELGYSWAFPNDLVVWEGQFGDFANGAQIVIDQYLTSSEKKWGATSGFVLLLPHGYDGQGPEHSNARLERFLASVDDNFLAYEQLARGAEPLERVCNMRVCNLTSAANYFHALRQQVKQKYRKPLVVMSPKKLLRDRAVRSSLSEFGAGGFVKLFDDAGVKAREGVAVVACCSGQIYFELLREREARGLGQKVALLRFEQLGPFPYAEFSKALQGYPKSARVAWVSEEPLNFGAYTYVQNRANAVLRASGFAEIEYVGRPITSVPAVGKLTYHKKQHQQLLDDLFAAVKP